MAVIVETGAPEHGSRYLGLLTDSVDVKTGTGVDNTDGTASSVPLFT